MICTAIEYKVRANANECLCEMRLEALSISIRYREGHMNASLSYTGNCFGKDGQVNCLYFSVESDGNLPPTALLHAHDSTHCATHSASTGCR